MLFADSLYFLEGKVVFCLVLNLEVDGGSPSPLSEGCLIGFPFWFRRMRCWVVLHSVALAYSEISGSYGIKVRVALGEMKCWHLSWKSLGGGGFYNLQVMLEQHMTSDMWVSPPLGPFCGEDLRAQHHLELVAEAKWIRPGNGYLEALSKVFLPLASHPTTYTLSLVISSNDK